MNEETALLRALLTTTGRAVFSVKEIYDLVSPTGSAPKQVQAFNLADGSRTQAQIVKETRIGKGTMSKKVTAWIEAGVMFRIGDDGDPKLLHIYAIPPELPKEQS